MPCSFSWQTILLEPIPVFQLKLIAMARSFNICNDGRTVCHVFNVRPHTIVLRRGMKIAKIASLTTLTNCSLVEDKNRNLSQRAPLHPKLLNSWKILLLITSLIFVHS